MANKTTVGSLHAGKKKVFWQLCFMVIQMYNSIVENGFESFIVCPFMYICYIPEKQQHWSTVVFFILSAYPVQFDFFHLVILDMLSEVFRQIYDEIKVWHLVPERYRDCWDYVTLQINRSTNIMWCDGQTMCKAKFINQRQREKKRW